MKIGEALRMEQEKLKTRRNNTARLECEIILAALLNWERHQLYINIEQLLDPQLLIEYQRLTNRRLKGEPVQYLTCSRDFMGLDFYVDHRVLIPRCDTEILVEFVMEQSVKLPGDLNILDIGTGSGAIAVSLAKLMDGSFVTAVDISEDALVVAKINAKRHLVDDKITFLSGDMFYSLSSREMSPLFDIIVSNPPYIPKYEIGQLMEEVRDYEPITALDGGDDGLDFYKRIAKEACQYMKRGGLLAVEVGYGQAEAVESILSDTGSYSIPIVIKDLAGIDRVVAAWFK